MVTGKSTPKNYHPSKYTSDVRVFGLVSGHDGYCTYWNQCDQLYSLGVQRKGRFDPDYDQQNVILPLIFYIGYISRTLQLFTLKEMVMVERSKNLRDSNSEIP